MDFSCDHHWVMTHLRRHHCLRVMVTEETSFSVNELLWNIMMTIYRYTDLQVVLNAEESQVWMEIHVKETVCWILCLKFCFIAIFPKFFQENDITSFQRLC